MPQPEFPILRRVKAAAKATTLDANAAKRHDDQSIAPNPKAKGLP